MHSTEHFVKAPLRFEAACSGGRGCTKVLGSFQGRERVLCTCVTGGGDGGDAELLRRIERPLSSQHCSTLCLHLRFL